jgi:hypothetical protein
VPPSLRLECHTRRLPGLPLARPPECRPIAPASGTSNRFETRAPETDRNTCGGGARAGRSEGKGIRRSAARSLSRASYRGGSGRQISRKSRKTAPPPEPPLTNPSNWASEMSWEIRTGQSYHRDHSDIVTPTSRDGKPDLKRDNRNGPGEDGGRGGVELRPPLLRPVVTIGSAIPTGRHLGRPPIGRRPASVHRGRGSAVRRAGRPSAEPARARSRRLRSRPA